MKHLLISKSVITKGAADDAPQLDYVEQHFDTPTNILVQTVLSSCFFNRQEKSYWVAEMVIDSWAAIEAGKEVVHTIPDFTDAVSQEIAHCTWVKARLKAQNGGGTGIMNIYV